jgi:outer membrane protein OmpA-like peptidoglycan-associated protein
MTDKPTCRPTSSARSCRFHAPAKCAYLLLCSLSLAFSSAPAIAEELSHDEMVCALDPECGMPFSDRRLRGITTTSSVRTPGSFDRTINFEFNSTELTAQARTELDQVAAALKDPSIEKYPIVVAGHTDGVGGVEYNQRLSQRRAESVRQYLIAHHGIDAKRLSAKGYGKSHLLLPSDPGNELNRRVQFQNPNYRTAAARVSASRPAPVSTAAAPPARPSQPTPTPEINGL